MYCHVSTAQKSGSDVTLAQRIGKSPKLHLREQRFNLQTTRALGAVSGVATGKDGLIYVIQRGEETDPIIVFDTSGRVVRSWGKGDFVLPHSLRIDPSGNVWALDAGASKVIEYTPHGVKLLTIALEPVPDTGSPFRGATDVAFVASGNVLVTDGYGNDRVLEFTNRGEKVLEWGASGSRVGQFHLPHSLQISSTGVVYVADRENGRIELFELTGKYLRSFDGLGRCYSLRLYDGALWVTMGPRHQDPGTPGWLVKMDPKSGRILGHLFVPEERTGHAFDFLSSGAVVETIGNGLLVFQAAKNPQSGDAASR